MGLEFKQRSLIKLNTKLFLDMHLLRENAFITIQSGVPFYDGSDPSVLLPDAEAHTDFIGVSYGQIWQSAFREFVYESGVPIDGTSVQTPPIVMSGIYVEGAFRAPNDPVFGHTIDFINGRIIFNSPKDANLKVNANFSVRECRVNFEHQFNQQYREGYLESKYTTNPLTSQQLVYPSGSAYPFPAVFIEVDERELKPYEMGNRSAVIDETINLYVWALNDMQRDNIVDILSSQWRKTIPIIDFNRAPLPLSGIHNTLSNEYIPYQLMLKNNQLVTTVGSGVPIRYLAFLDDVKARNMPASEEFERSIVTFNMKIYLNAPITPLGHYFGPINNIPIIQDIGM